MSSGTMGGCPIRELNWLSNVGLTQSVEFGSDFVSKGIQDGSGTKENEDEHLVEHVS